MIKYIKESYEELTKKVTWTPWSEAQKQMVVVVVFSLIFSLFIFAVDSIFETLIQAYFGLWK